ncbi:MAG: CDP-alcohol phosphatidyltransferase family protein [Oscillospiraceae bacterium]|jgi:cardiolipin synthase|nr:CDP-alcohol phosphatidyltransferase family protein [Oscillospiraceae bacterium]
MNLINKNIKKKIEKNLNIANFFTFFRIFLIIPFVYFFVKENYLNSALILLLSALSDALDGILARKFFLITNFGKILDPIADKLTLIAVITCIGIKFNEIFFFMIVLILKDLLMLIAGAYLLHRKITPPASKWYGKLSTVVFYVSAAVLVITKTIFKFVPGFIPFLLFSVTTCVMLFALFKYFLVFCTLLEEFAHHKK